MGVLSRGDIVQGDIVQGGYCPGGYCPGGCCPGGYCPGGYCPGGYCPRTLGITSGEFNFYRMGIADSKVENYIYSQFQLLQL